MQQQTQFLNVATVRCGAKHEITEVQLDGHGQINAYVGNITPDGGDKIDMVWMASSKAIVDNYQLDLVQKCPVKVEGETSSQPSPRVKREEVEEKN